MTSKEFPNALEIEKKLLSAMLLEETDIFPIVTGILTAEDFYRPQHAMIFRAIVTVFEEKRVPPDVSLVAAELKKRDELKKVELTYLHSLERLEFTTARAEAYAKTIREKAILRRLLAAGQEIAADAGNEIKSVEEVLGSAEKKILAISSRLVQTGFEPVTDIIRRSLTQIIHTHNNPGQTSGVPSGIKDLDKVTNGFRKSDLILLAARPSMGKTALALNIAVGAARKGSRVAIFSLEMSKVQLGNRLLSLESGVNSQSLNTGDFSDADMNELTTAAARLEDLKLNIDDTAGLSLLEMRSKARRLKHDKGLDFVVLDYLQLMQGTRAENRQQEISEISRNLKAMARELDIPILALSQLSRSVEMRAEKKPLLSDLRESGSLEQDADIVMFLYRDEYYNRDESEKQNLAEVIIAKNRNGPTTSIMLQFTKEIMRFGDWTNKTQ